MEREYRRPRLVIEEVRRKYKFLNTTGVRDCIFGNLTT